MYDGQEVESPQKLGLFVRDPINWNQPKAAAARAFYQRVVHLARTEPAFVSGGLEAVETSAPADIISYRRGNMVVLVNVRDHPVQFSVTGPGFNGAHDLLAKRVQRGSAVNLPAWGAMVLASK